ncbi:hypothetical protein JD292_11810 [Leucobacter sp. CSA2]|uniref:Uncharacterized protein n=1 Tax=Leucobacter edaphi TaxID=2796472 RepID=A0A934QEA8_9MICO|nr:hypothetical protein [Leucobacter edaphi]MBK0422758.1 hypothetical protein [Leucobacter edaphi]
MLDPIHQIIAGSVLLTVIGIAYGGYFLTAVARGKVPANDLQKTFFRAGHAHAGVLVTLGLLTMVVVNSSGVTGPLAFGSFGVLGAAILIPAGFFLSVVGKEPERPNRLMGLVWAGAIILTLGLVSAGVGLIIGGGR